MNETTLFLSPHLDDVVLSCPARVLTEAARGRRVVVATLFTEDESDPDQRALYERRREEDVHATGTLGAETRWLGLPDAPFRNPFYSSFRAIVLETHPDDAGNVSVVADAIHALYNELRPDALHVPLGVGTHIDHRLTHAAVEHLIETGVLDPRDIVEYEDRPYAFVHHQVRMRLAELGIRPADPPPSDLRSRRADELREEFLDSLNETAYVNTYLPSGAEREWCVRRLVEKLERPAPAGLVRRYEVLTLEGDDLDRAIRAAAAYESQIGELFGTVEAFAEAARAYAERLGVGALYAEREWRR